MSLYDGIDLDEKEGRKDFKPDVPGWGSRSKLIETQKQLQAKKSSLLNLKRRPNATVTPVFDLKKRNEEQPALTFNMQTGRMDRPVVVPVPVPVIAQPTPTPFIGAEAPTISSFLGVTDEYDPLHPNDYETYTKKRKEQRQKEREAERKREQEERDRRRAERHQEGKYSDEEEEVEKRRRNKRPEPEEEELDIRRDAGRAGGAAIAPPVSLLEMDAQHPDPMAGDGPGNKGSAGEYGGNFLLGRGSVVSKIMAKMGYKEGQGLGKSEQGMSTALQVEKTSKRGGKIIHEKDIAKVPEAPRAEVSNANLLRNPSKVILLRNMVGPGDVDEDLEPETAEECTKYGKVARCVIFEIPSGNDEEAVRIFVEFDRQESAIKAVVDLNGRFFGGRIVRCSFYNLDKFRRLDLADDPDQ